MARPVGDETSYLSSWIILSTDFVAGSTTAIFPCANWPQTHDLHTLGDAAVGRRLEMYGLVKSRFGWVSWRRSSVASRSTHATRLLTAACARRFGARDARPCPRHHLRPLLRPPAGGDRGGAHLRPARRRCARSAGGRMPEPRKAALAPRARSRKRRSDRRGAGAVVSRARTARPARTWPSCSCTAAAR